MRLLLLLLVVLAKPVFSQDLTGLWQAGDTIVSSNYQAHYIFSAGNKFTYNTSGYDGLQRIVAIGGRYKLTGKTLYLTPEYTLEKRQTTYVERSHVTTLNDSWAIGEGEIKKYKVARPLRQAAAFRLVKRKQGLCLLVDSQPFYRIKVSTN